MVRWAARHALEGLRDMQLGFGEQEARITWKGRSGWKLVDILPQLILDVNKARRKPDIIILHCGTNDLGSVPHHLIQRAMRSNFNEVFQSAPGAIILWSDIIPRKAYSVAFSTVKVDKARKKVNKFARKLLLGPRGGVIEHAISYKQSHLYGNRDEVHLSGAGNSVLVAEWKEAIQSYLAVWR